MTDLSATIAALEERAEGQKEWLREHHPEVGDDQKHLDGGTAERAYWHYGYMVALRDVIELLKQPGDTHNESLH